MKLGIPVPKVINHSTINWSISKALK